MPRRKDHPNYQPMIGVYINKEALEELRRRAKAERRSMSNLAALWIERALKETPSESTLARSA